jgi:nitrite reductase/ring-hydroxylating ferredoxin subunit
MMVLKKFWCRAGFILKYKTFRRIALNQDQSTVSVCHNGKVVKMPRRCPHQGAPLEGGYVSGNYLVCSWHGCKFALDSNGKSEAYRTTLKKSDALS